MGGGVSVPTNAPRLVYQTDMIILKLYSLLSLFVCLLLLFVFWGRLGCFFVFFVFGWRVFLLSFFVGLLVIKKEQNKTNKDKLMAFV